MNLLLIPSFSIFLILICLKLLYGFEIYDDESIKVKNGTIDLNSNFNTLFFTKNLSKLERMKFDLLVKSSEYNPSVVPKGSNLDYAVQLAIYTLSESQFVHKNYFQLYTKSNNEYVKNDMFKVVNCLYSGSHKGMKTLKVIRQRCFFHEENSQLGIFPKRLASKINIYCKRFKKVEDRFASLMDFIYLLRMILVNSKLHNHSLLKLSKLIWKMIKNHSLKKLNLNISLDDLNNFSNSNLKNSDRILITQIDNLLKTIDNTLLDKVKFLPFCISKTMDEYNLIMNDALRLSMKIWSPLINNINSNLNKINKCINKKDKTKNFPNTYTKTVEGDFVLKVSKMSKQILKEIKNNS